ncbi:tetraspanin-18-like [Phoenicopterus ruber ruber]
MGVLSCIKYLMFIFNVLVFAGGTCLAGVGVWVAADPAGFQAVVAAKPALSAGAYLLLAAGIALSLLGFLGCCGALRRSRPLLLASQEHSAGTGGKSGSELPAAWGCSDSSVLLPLQFFILVSLIFVAQLIGALLFLVHWKQIQPEQFLAELRRNYRGDEGAEIFSAAWNALMVTFSCCGVLGPEDFGNGSRFQDLHPGTPWPRACCARDGLLQAGELLGWEQCRERSPGYIHEQGCFSTFSRTLQEYVSVPGTCSLAVLGIEIFAMFFAFCLYYNFD